MPPPARNAIGVEDLREFRRDVRRADKEIGRELQKGLRESAQLVARRAGVLAPRRSGAMAAGYRGTARGDRGIVRNPVFYSRMIEFGWNPVGSGTDVRGMNVIGRALEQEESEVMDHLQDSMDDAARRLGWH